MKTLTSFLLLFYTAFTAHLQVHKKYNATIQNVINAACPQLSKLYISNLEAPNWIFGGFKPTQYKAYVDKQKQNNCIKICPINKPFSVGKECMNCPNDQIFNLKTKRCEVCPQDLYFNEKSKTCTVNPPLFFNTNPELKDQNYVGNPPAYDRSVKNCPQQFPFSNSVGCVKCQLPQYFNYSTMKCESCPQGHSFDIQQKQCLSDILDPIITPIKYTTLQKYSQKPVYEMPNYLKYANRNTNTQYKTPSLPITVRYLTSPQAPNLVFDGKKSKQYQRYYLSKNEQFKTCPAQKPYFDGRQCIFCKQQYPLFDVQRSQCIRCPQDEVYDPKSKRCRKRVQISPTIERYLMNIT